MIWAKTDAGRTEMQARALVKERARRNLLLLIDGVKSEEMLLANLAGISAADFQELRKLEPDRAGGRRRDESGAAGARDGVRGDPADRCRCRSSAEALDYAQFTAALTQLISNQLGLRGFTLTLAVEKARRSRSCARSPSARRADPRAQGRGRRRRGAEHAVRRLTGGRWCAGARRESRLRHLGAMAPRIFLPEPLREDAAVALPAAAVQHVHVLRLQPGDALTLFNGDEDAEWPGTIAAAGRARVDVRLAARRAVERELAFEVTLAIGIPANERMDALVEKAGELGAAAIQPLVCDRSVLRLSGERAEARRRHWQAVAASASEQCGRARVPRCCRSCRSRHGSPQRDAAAAGTRIVLSLDPAAVPPTARSAVDPPRRRRAPPLRIVVLSGPEGGLAPAEEDAAAASGFVRSASARASCAPTRRRSRCSPGSASQRPTEMNRKPAACAPRPARRRPAPRAEPATRSKRNRRHSIGPFHIGMRRDSFSRIALGSFGSGLRIQRSSRPGARCRRASSARRGARRSRPARRGRVVGASLRRGAALPPTSMRSPYGGLTISVPGRSPGSVGAGRSSASPPWKSIACGDAGALGVAAREVDHAKRDVAGEDRHRGRCTRAGACAFRRCQSARRAASANGSSRSNAKRRNQPGRHAACDLRRLDRDRAGAAARVVQCAAVAPACRASRQRRASPRRASP